MGAGFSCGAEMAFTDVTALGFTMASLVLSPIRRDAQLTCRPTKRRKLRHQQERKQWKEGHISHFINASTRFRRPFSRGLAPIAVRTA